MDTDPNFFGKIDKSHYDYSEHRKLILQRKQSGSTQNVKVTHSGAGRPRITPQIIESSEKGSYPFSENQFLQHRLC